MSHALITGGTGQVGHFITDRFLQEGWEVTLLVRNPAGIVGTTLFYYRLGENPELPAADLLVHCAFDHVPGRYRGGEGDDPDGFRKHNLDGSITLFEAARKANIPRVIFLSSRAVYGDYPPGTSLHEELPPRPNTLYGQIKLETENALAQMSGPDFTGVSLRATGVYGGAERHKWDEMFLAFLHGETPPPRVATEVHGEDLADAVWRLRDGKGGVFNVSDITLDRRVLLEMYAERAFCDTPLPARADARQISTMDTTKLRAEGWQPGGMKKLRNSMFGMLIVGSP